MFTLWMTPPTSPCPTHLPTSHPPPHIPLQDVWAGGGTTRSDGGHPVLGLDVQGGQLVLGPRVRGDIWSGGTAGPPTPVWALFHVQKGCYQYIGLCVLSYLMKQGLGSTLKDSRASSLTAQHFTTCTRDRPGGEGLVARLPSLLPDAIATFLQLLLPLHQ